MAGLTFHRVQVQRDPIQWALDRIESLLTHVEVIGSRGQLGVPQKLFKGYHIDSRLQAMGGVTVP